MGFLNQNKYRLLAVIIIFLIIFFIGKRLEIGKDLHARMLEQRIEESYSGFVKKKYIDSTEHNVPKLLISDTIIALDTEFWNKIAIGDSIVKLHGKPYITVYKAGGRKLVLDYTKYFNELSGTTSSRPALYTAQQGLLNDFENDFSENQKHELSKILLDFNIKSKNKIIVVSLSSVPTDYDFQVFAENLGKQWKIEQNNQGKVILIAFSKSNRKVALTVANGVKDLQEETINELVTEEILPEFKKDNYYQGVKNGILAISRNWQ